MVRSLSNTKLTIKASADLGNTLLDSSGTTKVSHPNLNYSQSLTSGTNSGQANRSWQILSQLLPSGAPERSICSA